MQFLNSLIRRLSFKNDSTKKILIISTCFAGGGLETRINSIVDKFCNQYSFSLLTKTLKKEMRIPVSVNFKNIYTWDEEDFAISNADIISIHPYSAFLELKNPDLLLNKKLIYTLHGESSLFDNLNRYEKNIEIFYTVSSKLIPDFKKKYPLCADKIHLFKNYFPKKITRNICAFQNNNNILISVTNTNSWNFLNDIIQTIPKNYNIHIIGHIPKNKYNHPNIFYDGFVKLEDYFLKNKFFAAITRGGFAAQDIIAANIPTILIYDRKDTSYLELLTKDNFKQLSNQNFVTWKADDNIDLAQILLKIKQNPKNYSLQNLLKKHNDISLMFNPYKAVESTSARLKE